MSKNWTYSEGKALINIYSNRKEEYFKIRNKKHFWESILTDLESLDILTSPTSAKNVEVKWRSLYRAYKNAKDRGPSTSRSKFMYMDEMDDIFADNPPISSIYAVSVGVEGMPVPAPIEIENPVSDPIFIGHWPVKKGNEVIGEKKKKKKKDTDTLLSIKKNYYNKKIEIKEKKNEMLKNYLDKKEIDREKNQKEIVDLLKTIINDIFMNCTK